MNIASIISGFLGPATKIIDEVITSKEEKLTLKNELKKIEVSAMQSMLDYEKTQLKERASIVRAEAQGDSWLQKSWRPILMLIFAGLIIARWMGYSAENLSPEEYKSLWDIIKLGLGGYVIGRSAEKVVPKITESLNKNK